MSPDGTAVRDHLRVGPGAADLAAIDPRSTPGLPAEASAAVDRKAWSREEFTRLGPALAQQQEILFADALKRRSANRLLVVLQAMDCGGKDGTVKRVAGAMNPLGLHPVAFGRPTEEELAHDFLWRIRRALPPAGFVGVFNRSHYEDVLVARVDQLVPEPVWRDRYEQINAFEEELVAGGVKLIKVFLHISREEQRKRLLERITDPTKHWKYDPSDLDARAQWEAYQAAYVDVFRRCGPDHAPWYVVPADRKWYRNWAVANLIMESFADLDLTYPLPDFDPIAERKRIEAESGERRIEGERQVNGR